MTRRGGLLFGEFVVSGNDQKLKFLPTYFRDSAGFGLNNARGELGGVSSIVAASGVTLKDRYLQSQRSRGTACK